MLDLTIIQEASCCIIPADLVPHCHLHVVSSLWVQGRRFSSWTGSSALQWSRAGQRTAQHSLVVLPQIYFCLFFQLGLYASWLLAPGTLCWFLPFSLTSWGQSASGHGRARHPSTLPPAHTPSGVYDVSTGVSHRHCRLCTPRLAPCPPPPSRQSGWPPSHPSACFGQNLTRIFSYSLSLTINLSFSLPLFA